MKFAGLPTEIKFLTKPAKMKRFIYSIILSIISIVSLNAQQTSDAESIIKDLIGTFSNNAVKGVFTLSTNGNNSVISQTNKGTFVLKGNKFVIEMEGVKVWFDGKTQWTYVTESNEVSINEPDQSELIQTNPIALLSDFKSKSKVQFSKQKSSSNYIVELIPKLKNKDFNKVEVQTSKTNGNLVSVTIHNNDKSQIKLSISNIQKGIKFSETLFAFDKSSYRGVTINDMR